MFVFFVRNGQFNFVEYPPEEKKLPSGGDIMKMMQDREAKRQLARVDATRRGVEAQLAATAAAKEVRCFVIHVWLGVGVGRTDANFRGVCFHGEGSPFFPFLSISSCFVLVTRPGSVRELFVWLASFANSLNTAVLL